MLTNLPRWIRRLRLQARSTTNGSSSTSTTCRRRWHMTCTPPSPAPAPRRLVACIGRTARHDTELGGHPIRARESVLVYWVSANRDPSEFEHPDTFDIDRPRNRHLAFGAGPHRCAGSHLAADEPAHRVGGDRPPAPRHRAAGGRARRVPLDLQPPAVVGTDHVLRGRARTVESSEPVEATRRPSHHLGL